MALKTVVENLDDVDEAFRGEYQEVTDPKTKAKTFVLALEGVQQHPDIVRQTAALAKEREDHKGAKAKLTALAALGDPAEVQAKLDRIPELEAAAAGNLDEAKINAIVDTRVKAKVAPVERERDQFKAQVAERDGTIATFNAKERTRTIGAAIGKAARELKVVDTALEDVELYGERLFEVQEDGGVVTRDNVGVTPGLSPKAWLEDMQAKRPHWWGPTNGGGAGGGKGGNTGGANPWAYDTWNVTEQNRVYVADKAKAERLAKAAGTTIGGGRPQKPK